MKVKPKIIVPDLSDVVIEIPDEKIEQVRKDCNIHTTIFGREKPRKEPLDEGAIVNEYINVITHHRLEESGKLLSTLGKKSKIKDTSRMY